MLVVNRFRVGDDEGPRDAGELRTDLESVLALLRAKPGFLAGHVGRNMDDPDLWLLTTTWTNVGAYRRAIGSYEAKLHAVPVLSRAVDEPSAYEVVEPETVLNIDSPRSIG